MKTVYIINAHQPYPFSEGKLNAALAERAKAILTGAGVEVQTLTMTEEYKVEQELERHQWADAVLLQSPVNWMGVSWSFKKYMDEVYSAGMGGQLCAGDGRTREDASKQYGTGGTLVGKKYMLSLTFNAPKESFDDPDQFLFQGRSVDDLWMPMHMNFRFFAMEALETFCCFDVMKNPDIDNDFQRFDRHIREQFLVS